MTCKVCGSFRQPELIGEVRPNLGFIALITPLPNLFACPDCGNVYVDPKIFRPKKETVDNQERGSKNE